MRFCSKDEEQIKKNRERKKSGDESVVCFSEEPLEKTHQNQRLGVMLL